MERTQAIEILKATLSHVTRDYTPQDEALDTLCKDLERLTAEKNGAYSERDKLISLVSKCFPAWLERHPDSDATWEDDWRWIVFVKLPTGQASWHIHDSELPWFSHLERYPSRNSWDGHTTEEKYNRVLRVDDIANRPAVV